MFYAAKEAFEYDYPNYNVTSLAGAVCDSLGFDLIQVRFYRGVPNVKYDKRRHTFWSAKFRHMGRKGVKIFARELRYRKRSFPLPNGKKQTVVIGEEKGVDVRLAVDLIRLALRRYFDAAVVFSQDQDFSEVAKEIRAVAKEQKRWIKMVSAYPCSTSSKNRRGIDRTDWFRINRKLYDSCIDKHDSRKRS